MNEYHIKHCEFVFKLSYMENSFYTSARTNLDGQLSSMGPGTHGSSSAEIATTGSYGSWDIAEGILRVREYLQRDLPLPWVGYSQ